MKLLQINSVVNTGSTGRIVEDIALLAMKNGWESYVAYGRNSQESQSETIRVGNCFDKVCHGIGTRLFDRHGLVSRAATKILIRKIKKMKPDIIHIHNIHGYYLNYPLLFNYLSDSEIPVVWTLHDCWSFTGHCTYFSFIGCDRWRTGCFSCPQKKKYPGSLYVDRSYKNYIDKRTNFNLLNNLTLVPVSNWLKELVKDSFLSKHAIQRIYNGVDTMTFSIDKQAAWAVRERYSLQDKIILLGVATAWEDRKGLTDFIKLSKSLPVNFKIVLVGLSLSQLKQLPIQILGLPRTESLTELSALYNAADIVLNLSSEETFGLTTVEGFACGTPGIVYNCTASPELITDETGVVVERGDLTVLLNAIHLIVEKGKSFYSVACRQRALDYFGKEDRYAEYIELYNKLVN